MKRHERSLARRCALQVLYQSEILNKPADQVVEEGLVPEEAGMGNYARMLIMGVSSHKAELDRTISVSSRNWAIDRMPVVDRSILRLATFEVKYVDDVPVSVAINEAVELAKEFGGEDDSHRFVNGILGRIARDCESQENASEPEAQPQAAPAGGVSAEEAAPAEEAFAETAAATEAAPAETVTVETDASAEGAFAEEAHASDFEAYTESEAPAGSEVSCDAEDQVPAELACEPSDSSCDGEPCETRPVLEKAEEAAV